MRCPTGAPHVLLYTFRMSCGGQCICAQTSLNDNNAGQPCATQEKDIALDKEGKCPCKKSLADCCHKDVILKNTGNPAMDELCRPHNNKTVCE